MVNYVKQRSIFKGKVRRDSQFYIYPTGVDGKVGATAGWTASPAVDKDYSNLPASQTSATLVVPLGNLKKGATIQGFYLQGCINSAGGSASIAANLRKSTPAAGATPTDASVASNTTLTVTAATAMSQANTEKTGLTEVVDGTSNYYMLITGTTAASTSAALEAIVLEVQEA